MNTIDMYLSRLHGDDQAAARRDPTGARGKTLQEIRLAARGRFQALADRIATIRQETSRSPVGIQQAIAELASKTDLGFLTSAQASTDDDLARYRMLLCTTPKSDKSEVLAFLSEQEIRAKYADAPPHVVLMAYQLAVTEGHYEGQRALTQGPLGSLVDKEFQHRALLDHAKKTQPAVYESFEQAQIMKEHLDSLADQAQQVLAVLKDETPARAAVA